MSLYTTIKVNHKKLKLLIFLLIARFGEFLTYAFSEIRRVSFIFSDIRRVFFTNLARFGEFLTYISEIRRVSYIFSEIRQFFLLLHLICQMWTSIFICIVDENSYFRGVGHFRFFRCHFHRKETELVFLSVSEFQNLCEFIPLGTTLGKDGSPSIFILYTFYRLKSDLRNRYPPPVFNGGKAGHHAGPQDWWNSVLEKMWYIIYNSWPYFIWTGCIIVQCFTFSVRKCENRQHQVLFYCHFAPKPFGRLVFFQGCRQKKRQLDWSILHVLQVSSFQPTRKNYENKKCF
jgi:hypothetical protein